MKESKIIVIVLSLSLVILILLAIYYYTISDIIYNILISIITGAIVSIITSLCQYFVIKEKIKNNIFHCYFDMYKTIYASIHKKRIFSYPVLNIYKKLFIFSDELSKNLSEYSTFFPTRKTRLYKKLNPAVNPDFNKFNTKNLLKLFFPCNQKRFNELIIPIQNTLENILKEIDSKKFLCEFEEYKRIFDALNK